MKKTVVLVVFILLVLLGILQLRAPSAPDGESAEPAVQADSQMPLQVSPEIIRDRILMPTISFHPGTAGSSLGCAQAAAAVASFSAEYQLRFADEEQLLQAMEDALALLSDEETDWFRENLPRLIDLIDAAYVDYSGVSGVFADAGAEAAMKSALETAGSKEDWSLVKAVLLRL